MSIPSAADLIEELRCQTAEDSDRLTDEQLAGRLPITLSTLNRWKKEDPRHYTSLMKMLRQAGWLNEDRVLAAVRAAERARAEETERRAASLAEREERAPRKRRSA
jgi:hypothetical protein